MANQYDGLKIILTDLPVGTFTIQYGFSHVWQLTPSGAWVEV